MIIFDYACRFFGYDCTHDKNVQQGSSLHKNEDSSQTLTTKISNFVCWFFSLFAGNASDKDLTPLVRKARVENKRELEKEIKEILKMIDKIPKISFEYIIVRMSNESKVELDKNYGINVLEKEIKETPCGKFKVIFQEVLANLPSYNNKSEPKPIEDIGIRGLASEAGCILDIIKQFPDQAFSPVFKKMSPTLKVKLENQFGEINTSLRCKDFESKFEELNKQIIR